MKLSSSARILALLLMILPALTGAESRNRWWLDLNLTSRHSRDMYRYEGDDHEYNSRNYGLGLTYDWKDWCELKAGWFNNSYHKTSLYAVAHPRYDFVGSPRFMLAVGAGVGAITGYDDTVDDLPPVSPMGILTLTISDERRWRALLGYQPFRLILGSDHADVVTLQVSWKL